MSTWNTTSTNSHFGSTGDGPAIEGSSFYRLVQQAVAIDPVAYKSMIKCAAADADSNHNLKWLPESSKYPPVRITSLRGL